MSWYKGVAVDSTTLNMADHADCSWLNGRSISTQVGVTVAVESVGKALKGNGCDVSLVATHGGTTGTEVWFQLASSQPAYPLATASASSQPAYPLATGSASSQPAYPLATASASSQPAYPLAAVTGAQPAYPLLPGASPAANAARPSYPLSSSQGDATAYPPMPGGARASATQPAYPTLGVTTASDIQPAYPAMPPTDRPAFDDIMASAHVHTRPRVNTFDHAAADSDTTGNSSASSSSSSSNNMMRDVAAAWLVPTLNVIVQMFICQAIGGSSMNKWLMVLAWTLIGCPVAAFGFAMLSTRAAQYESRMTFTAAVVAILSIVWVNSFGIPLAMLEGKQNVIEAMLAPSRSATVACYKNNTQTFTSASVNFIFLQDASWSVDYSVLDRQKVTSEPETNDDGARTGRYFNYCVAPIVYKGNVPCNYNMWAICYMETPKGSAIGTTCDATSARLCGWDNPGNGVVLRPTVPGETFFVEVPDDELTLYNKALTLADTTGTTTVPKVMVLYGATSPSELDDESDVIDNLSDTLMISSTVTYAAVALIVVLVVYVKNGCNNYE